MEITDHRILTENYHEDRVTDAYREFRDAEGIPVHHELFYDDRDAVATGEWDRTGQRGAFLNLHGIQGVFDIQLHELVPGGETTRQHHLYQEIVYVSQGRGATQVGTGADATTFEWSENSLFFIPQNLPYKHMNHSDSEPAHLFAQTTLPQLYSIVPYEHMIFEPGQDISKMDEIDEEFYSADGKLYEPDTYSGQSKAAWEANFVPDIIQFDELRPRTYRGACKSVNFDMPKSNIWTHAAEFPRGMYMNAHHRAGPAAVYTILSGEGYSLMWQEGWDQIGKIEWSPGTIISYPHDCLHQHFNTGTTPARYLAWHAPTLGALGEIDMYDGRAPENVIQYHEEDPIIREHYLRQLEAAGEEFRMPEELFTDPDYELDTALVA